MCDQALGGEAERRSQEQGLRPPPTPAFHPPGAYPEPRRAFEQSWPSVEPPRGRQHLQIALHLWSKCFLRSSISDEWLPRQQPAPTSYPGGSGELGLWRCQSVGPRGKGPSILPFPGQPQGAVSMVGDGGDTAQNGGGRGTEGTRLMQEEQRTGWLGAGFIPGPVPVLLGVQIS